MAISIITDEEVVGKRISDLPERPTDPFASGGKNMTSRELRAYHDLYPNLLRSRLNAVISALKAVPGSEDVDAFADIIKIAPGDENGDPASLSDTIDAIREAIHTLDVNKLEEADIEASVEVVEDTIPRRDATGHVKTATPDEDDDSVPKSYIENFRAILKGTGTDSFTNKVTDPERVNAVLGNYSGSVGSRNYMGEKASESLTVGGLIEHYAQNGLTVGYRAKARANQSITCGYRVENKASESIQVGEYQTIDGTLTEDEDGNPKSNSRYHAQFGRHNEMGVGNRCNIQSGEYNEMDEWCEGDFQSGSGNIIGSSSVRCFQSGENLTQGSHGKWNFMQGYGHIFGDYVECVTVTDYSNEVESYITDSLIAGYDNRARNKNGSSDNKKYDIYMLGHDNTNRDSGNNDHSNIYEFGKGLRPTEDDQALVGAYNYGTNNCWFEVGCGTSNSNRKTAFAVCQQGDNYWIEMNRKVIIPPLPTTNGTYALTTTVSGGSTTCAWVAQS